MGETQQVQVIEVTAIEALQKAEVNTQIATAKQFPRSLKRFLVEAKDMATLNESIAAECIYCLPRDGKTIEGASARFAEIVLSSWGNSRAGARIVEESENYVTAQGFCHDLERNVAVTFEVRRKITGKSGKRFSADMIGMTANAACSIAFRNAVLKSIPKAFWQDIYNAARQVIAGDAKTLQSRRDEAVKYITKMGITVEQICATLGVAGVEDIGADELVTLRGMATAIKEGDTTIDEAFGLVKKEDKAAKKGTEGLKEKLGIKKEAEQPSLLPEGSGDARD